MTRAASDDAAVRVLAAIIVESSRMPKDDVVNLTTREMFMKEYSGQEEASTSRCKAVTVEC